MTIPNELRELLEQICVELEHDNDRYMLARELRKALAQPAAHADGEAVEVAKVVSYLSACADGYDPDAPHPGPPEPLMTVAQHQRILAAAVPAGTVAVSDGCVLVPEARETGSWESARIGDFNAGWNACRESVITLLKKAAYMELDTSKRSIAIQDELRALLASVEGGE